MENQLKNYDLFHTSPDALIKFLKELNFSFNPLFNFII